MKFKKQFLAIIGPSIVSAFTLNIQQSVLLLKANRGRRKVRSFNVYFSSIKSGVTSILPLRNNSKNQEIDVAFPSSEDEETDSTNYCNLPRLYVGPTPSHVNSVQSIILKDNAMVQLSSNQSHYLMKVMRFFSKKKKKKKNMRRTDLPKKHLDFDASECVRLFDGINGEWLCQVIDPMIDLDVTRDGAAYNGSKNYHRSKYRDRDNLNLVAECLIQLKHQYPPSLTVFNDSYDGKQRQKEECITSRSPVISKAPWLFFAPIKKQRAKVLVEKCTELGCGIFSPVISEFTDSFNCKSNDQEKLQLVAEEAAEQCERLTVPAFVSVSNLFQGEYEEEEEPLNVEYLLKNWVVNFTSSNLDRRILLICRERRNADSKPGVFPILKAFDLILGEQSVKPIVAFLVGPEGGWSASEEELFDQYSANFPDLVQGISLGRRILRAETAGVIAVGAYSLRFLQ